jgi:hypothetical protein
MARITIVERSSSRHKKRLGGLRREKASLRIMKAETAALRIIKIDEFKKMHRPKV